MKKKLQKLQKIIKAFCFSLILVVSCHSLCKAQVLTIAANTQGDLQERSETQTRGYTSLSDASLRTPVNIADRPIRGRVISDTGEPLIGVTILLKGDNTTGTITDASGYYSLDVPDNGAVLVFSYIGFVTREVEVGDATSTLDVTMEVDAKALSEVVIIGYGSQKRENVVGSVSQLSADKVENRPVTQLKDVLTGQLAGVTVTQRGGRPGFASGSIMVRGMGSFGASPSALILVDGIPVDNFNDIDPNDVEAISVLKDASSAAIYGARAANGVILVTTKSGKAGEPKLSYNSYVGFQNRPHSLNS